MSGCTELIERRMVIDPPLVHTKRLVRAYLRWQVRPRVWLYRRLWERIGPDRAMQWASESVAGRPGPLGVLYRAAFYENILAGVGEDVTIGLGTCFSRAEAVLGDRVYLGRYCSVGWAEIGDEVKVADGAQLLSGRRHHEPGCGTVKLEKITIGRGAWIGAGAIVMADVGEAARVGAGSVVVHPVPAGTTVAGIPARPIRNGQPLAYPQPRPRMPGRCPDGFVGHENHPQLTGA